MASMDLASGYLKLGKTKRAKRILEQTHKVLKNVVLPPDISSLLMLKRAEVCVANNDVEDR
jgi:hypothetical protein